MYENLWQRFVKIRNEGFIINLSLLLLFVNRACPSTSPLVSPHQALTLRKLWRQLEVRFSNSVQTRRYLRSTKTKMWVSPNRRVHFCITFQGLIMVTRKTNQKRSLKIIVSAIYWFLKVLKIKLLYCIVVMKWVLHIQG